MLLRRRPILRKEPRQERASFTFAAILDAAQLVMLGGEPDFHMAVLAKRAGVSIGTLYQYFPDRIAVLTALLDRVWDRSINDFRLAFNTLRKDALIPFLEDLSGVVAKIALREHELRVVVHAELRRAGMVGPQVDISREWIEFFADFLKGFFPNRSPEHLLSIGRAMVWTADGMVDGLSAWHEVSEHEFHLCLLTAWKGIASR
jgi:AcrR family transcriptional regulator